MFSHWFDFITTLAAFVTVSTATSSFAERNVDRVRGEVSGVFNLDKSWTSGGEENKNGSQVATLKALASRVSLGAERTGLCALTGFPLTRHAARSSLLTPNPQ